MGDVTSAHRASWCAWLVATLAFGGCGEGRTRDAAPSTATPRTEDGAAPVPGPRVRRGGMDLTFLVTADTHFGHAGVDAQHERAIDAMHDIAGRPFPAALGGRVGTPRGVLVAGDLTENGKPEEWARFERFFGQHGNDGRLRFPVFEALGNHDRHAGEYVASQIARRHGAGRYGWDWDDVHVVSLGEGPNTDDLVWLRADLARVGRDVGVVLFFHFPLEGPYANGWWFTDAHREALREAVAGHRVLGVFHGHYHATGTYRWRGLDAYNPGSVKHGGRSFLVVRVGDEQMTVAAWSYGLGTWTWWHQKPIFDGRGADKRSLTGATVGQPGWARQPE